MPHRIRRRRPGLAGCLTVAVAVAAVGLTACGGGSSKATSNASATTTTGAAGGGARFTALRTCLAKNGITLPARPARPAGAPRPEGAPRGTGGIFGGGAAGGAAGAGRPGFQLPAGVTQAQFQAAIAKCGGFGGPGAGAARRTLTPTQKAAQQAALVKFAACMKTNGIALPAPNTSGTGPVFNTSKLNTTSPQFVAATKKCMSLLPARFGRGGRPGGPPVGTTTTPTTSTAS